MIGQGSDEVFNATNIDEQVRMTAPMTPIMIPLAVNWALKARLPFVSDMMNHLFRYAIVRMLKQQAFHLLL
jgi:hypothetical protein